MRAILKKLHAGRKKQAEEQPKPAIGQLAQQHPSGPKRTGSDYTSDLAGNKAAPGHAFKTEAGGVGAGPVQAQFLGPNAMAALSAKIPVVRLSKQPVSLAGMKVRVDFMGFFAVQHIAKNKNCSESYLWSVFINIIMAQIDYSYEDRNRKKKRRRVRRRHWCHQIGLDSFQKTPIITSQ
jgi:hypothetical protein